MPKQGTTLSHTERMLIIAKTYPTPSKGNVETTCVAAINDAGELRRIFPVPFRLLPKERQFAKWQWITASFRLPGNDRRPESRRIDVDSIVIGEQIDTKKNGWADRLKWIYPHIVPSFTAIEERRIATGETLGFIRPSRLLGLDITPLPAKERDWDDKERAKLTRDLEVADMFSDNNPENVYRRRMLQKLPYHFHYRYEIDTPSGPQQHRHLITDWEAGQLYRNCADKYGENWEKFVRARLETDFASKDLVFMMGTQHTYPDQWLIISLIYPPQGSKWPETDSVVGQGSLPKPNIPNKKKVEPPGPTQQPALDF